MVFKLDTIYLILSRINQKVCLYKRPHNHIHQIMNIRTSMKSALTGSCEKYTFSRVVTCYVSLCEEIWIYLLHVYLQVCWFHCIHCTWLNYIGIDCSTFWWLILYSVDGLCVLTPSVECWQSDHLITIHIINVLQGLGGGGYGQDDHLITIHIIDVLQGWGDTDRTTTW